VTTLIIFSRSGSNAGVGFAVPVNTVKRVVPALIATGRYADPWLGIQGLTLTPLIAEALDLPVERGVLLQEVVRGGPADKAGLRAGDRQVAFEGGLLAANGKGVPGGSALAGRLQPIWGGPPGVALQLSCAATGPAACIALTCRRDGHCTIPPAGAKLCMSYLLFHPHQTVGVETSQTM